MPILTLFASHVNYCGHPASFPPGPPSPISAAPAPAWEQGLFPSALHEQGLPATAVILSWQFRAGIECISDITHPGVAFRNSYN